MDFEELGILDKTRFAIDGERAVVTATEIMEEALMTDPQHPVQPIQVMFLDFQMPHKNGLQVVKEVKALYEASPILIPPVYIFVSAFMSNKQFRKTANDAGVEHLFSKPMSEHNKQ